MRESPSKDLLVEIYKFNQHNRLDFYNFVKVILEQSQCALITKPYWPVVDGNPGAEVFTIFPDLECPVCEVVEESKRFKTQDVKELTKHAIDCLSKKDVTKRKEDQEFYRKYGLVPKSVKAVVESARTQRDHKAVCIAPVLDHPQIKGLADLQRKERERITDEMARENSEKTMGPRGPVLKLAKGAEMRLDRMVWIQTPLTSELATLLLAGMQPIRHSSSGIHLPILMRETGITKVLHLNVDRFEELAAVRTAEQNYEMMKVELQQVGILNEVDTHEGPVAPCIPDVMTGDPKDSFNKIVGKSLNIKRPNELITDYKMIQRGAEDVNRERSRVDREKNQESGNLNRRFLAEITKEKAAEAAAAFAAKAAAGSRSPKRANGDRSPTHRSPTRYQDAFSDEKPGCSKYL